MVTRNSVKNVLYSIDIDNFDYRLGIIAIEHRKVAAKGTAN